MLDFLRYGFMIRGLEAGILVGLICPLIGIFLVLRRYSLMADALSHVSLAGVALGLIAGINPLITALFTTALASVLIENLRTTRKIYGESALSLFLSGSLAVAIVLITVKGGFNVDLFSYLFGSIVTVSQNDVLLIAFLSAVIIVSVVAFYKELVFISFDEETAGVTGIPTKLLNTFFIILAALTIAVSMPVVGILLISALMVVPVITALQLKKNFQQTIVWAQIFSVFSVVAGIISSFYLNIPAGGSIVIIAILIFGGVLFIKKPLTGQS